MVKAMKTITDKKGGSMGTGYSGVSGFPSSQSGSNISSGAGSSAWNSVHSRFARCQEIRDHCACRGTGSGLVFSETRHPVLPSLGLANVMRGGHTSPQPDAPVQKAHINGTIAHHQQPIPT